MLRIFVCAIAVLLLCSHAGSAQPAQSSPDTLEKYASGLLQQALKSIDRAICDGGKRCAPASVAEFANPPLSVEDARAAIHFATRSALAELCGLDYRRSFLQLMQIGRQQRKMSDRQIALLAVIHGIAQGDVTRGFKASNRQCTPDMKAKLDAELPKVPG